MRKHLSRSVAGLSALLAAAIGGSAALANPVTLRVGDNLPRTHILSASTRYFMDEVTKATNGEVKFEYFPAEQAGKAKDMLMLTQSGVVDIGLVLTAYVSDKLPLSSVADLPGAFGTSCEGAMALWKLAKEGGWLAQNEYKQNSIRVMFASVPTPYQLFLTKDRLKEIADVKGQKIRSVAGVIDVLVNKLGATPVRTTAPEAYEALSRGTLDGALLPPPNLVSYEIHKLLKVGTIGRGFGSTAILYAMSERKWQSLSESAKTAIREVGERTTRRACEAADQDLAVANKTMQDSGVRLMELPASDEVKLQEIFKSVREDWAGNLDKRRKPGTEAVKAFQAAIAGGGS